MASQPFSSDNDAAYKKLRGLARMAHELPMLIASKELVMVAAFAGQHETVLN